MGPAIAADQINNNRGCVQTQEIAIGKILIELMQLDRNKNISYNHKNIVFFFISEVQKDTVVENFQ